MKNKLNVLVIISMSFLMLNGCMSYKKRKVATFDDLSAWDQERRQDSFKIKIKRNIDFPGYNRSVPIECELDSGYMKVEMSVVDPSGKQNSAAVRRTLRLGKRQMLSLIDEQGRRDMGAYYPRGKSWSRNDKRCQVEFYTESGTIIDFRMSRESTSQCFSPYELMACFKKGTMYYDGKERDADRYLEVPTDDKFERIRMEQPANTSPREVEA